MIRTTPLGLCVALAILLGVGGCKDRQQAAAPPAVASAEPARADPVRADPADWCAGHGLPESSCTRCNPELLPKFKRAGDWCEEHGFPESACPTCNPMKPPAAKNGTGADSESAGTRLRLKSPDIERAAGVETEPVRRGTVGGVIRCTARIEFDRNRVAEISAPVSGIVRGVLVDLGQRVSAGQALFLLESASVGAQQERRRATRERVEAARANLARQQKLRVEAIASQRQLELARRELESARAEARSIQQSLKISGASRRGRPGLFRVSAPIAGLVIRRPAVRGTHASPSRPLATVADTSVMWALLDVPEQDAPGVQLGQGVEVQVEGVVGKTLSGVVDWIAAEVDPRTRTVAARVVLKNTAGVLRSGQFARATIRLPTVGAAVTVPAPSVQSVGERSVVFVRTAAGRYESREVRPGPSDGRRVQVQGALKPGEAVVTTGAFLLRTELDRGSIGAGCCELQAPGGH